MRRILFVTTSPRSPANSTALARQVALGLPASIRQDWVDLNVITLPAFCDTRPVLPPPPDPVLADLLARILLAEMLVIAAPIYWYAFPAPLHLMLSHMSAWMDQPSSGFHAAMQTKTVALVTSRADPDPSVPLGAEAMLRRSFEWMGARWHGGLHGVADAPGDITADPAFATAPAFLAKMPA